MTLPSLPPEWPDDLLPRIQTLHQAANKKLVVLDDDPTGTQTVYGVTVVTRWDTATVAQALKDAGGLFYILTNSRSLPEAEAQELATTIGRNLREASAQTGVPLTIISRSDSTLRGHYPAEVTALTEALEYPPYATLLIPAFIEGKRYTLEDTHYLESEGALIPVAQTPFAQDSAFGFRHSNLKAWVEEKTNGHIKAPEVAALSLEAVRRGGPEQVAAQLMKLSPGSVCVVNAVSYRDLEVVSLAALQAEALGKTFLYRTAASFVRARAGLSARPYLTRRDLKLSGRGALVVVGSYVSLTTRQLSHLLEHAQVTALELPVTGVLDTTRRPALLAQTVSRVNAALEADQTVVLYTSRELIGAGSASTQLATARIVSDALVKLVQGLTVRPRFLLAKGGITSSDLATRGLQVSEATVLGQITAGVPVWQLGEDASFPGLPYIVFPGNVGTETTLLEVVKVLNS
jgi:uncharacterized protein YgbK (DUF1537 family)